MKIFVDIDETICFYDGVDRLGYKNAIPNIENITKINKANILTKFITTNPKV